MALELRPNCEYCDVDLPPASTNAMICTSLEDIAALRARLESVPAEQR